jgi:hypothetical protein
MRFFTPTLAASAAIPTLQPFLAKLLTSAPGQSANNYCTESIPSVGVMSRDLAVLHSGQTKTGTCHWSFVPRKFPQ